MRRFTFAAMLALGPALCAPAARADEAAWTRQIVYTADVLGPVAGADKRAGRYLDNLDVSVDGDLGKAFGWTGATVHASVVNNAGGKPNELAGTLQGVDSIEVAQARTRLYELWIDQGFAGGRASLRAGLYDLNSEFYATPSSDLLLAPAFGIGSELGATGRHGPSIFPLTSLAVRMKLGGESGPYAQAAVLSAHAGAWSEPSRLTLGLDEGAILIGEVGVHGPRRVALGAWTYSRKAGDLYDRGPTGEPLRRQARGAYLLGEDVIWRSGADRTATAFLRLGVSDGRTSPFRGGWQAGLRIDRLAPGRPDSTASIGLQQGLLSGPQRALGRDAGLDLRGAESGIEATVSDTYGRLTVQPDLQLIEHQGGEPRRRPVVVAGVRFSLRIL
jgi:porin